MPRNGSGVASRVSGAAAVPNTTIESSKYNSEMDDIYAMQNEARPITAGGTASTTADGALTALGGTTVGKALFTADDAVDVVAALGAEDILDALGAGETGKDSLAASTAAEGRTAIGAASSSDLNDKYDKTGGTISGDVTLSSGSQIFADAGSASDPSYSFFDDANTGLINSSNGVVGTICNGVEKSAIGASASYFKGILDTTTGSAANVFVNASTGLLARSTSSKRYKNNIKDYDKGLSEVLSLRPVRFNGKGDGDTEYAGFIAEEVHAAGLHEFVVYDDKNRPDALHYPHMVALLASAIKELSQRIENLENN